MALDKIASFNAPGSGVEDEEAETETDPVL